MATRINTFLDTIGQGVKPNMFSINIEWPSDLGENSSPTDDKNLINVLCKSAALPASNLGVIEVPFRGRTVKIAGDRTFDTWTATFFNDKEMKGRTYFEQWLESMNTHEGNYSPSFLPSKDSGYMATVKVKQLEKHGVEGGKILRQYNLMPLSQLTSLRSILLMTAMIRSKSSLSNSSILTGWLTELRRAT